MILPRIPHANERLSSGWGRQVAEALQSLRISGGLGIRVARGTTGTTISAVAAPPAATATFPWGPQWMWGIDIRRADDGQGGADGLFTLYNAAVRLGTTIIPTLLADDDLDPAAGATLGDLPLDARFGIALELNWSAAGGAYPFDPALVLVKNTNYLWTPDAGEYDADATPERIPVATFAAGLRLERYWAPGAVYTPQIWVGASPT